ncbi:MAG: redoxin domain-containing protein [Cyclobacteriaceae bacterium]
MRLFVFTIFFSLALSSLGQGHEIRLTIDGMRESEAIIGYHYGKQKLIHDTVEVVENELIIKGTAPLPTGIYFVYTPSFYFEFIVKEQQFSLELNTAEGFNSLSVTGSLENELFRMFQVNMGKYQREMNSYSAQLDSLTGQDSISVREKLIKISTASTSFRDSLIAASQGSFFHSFLKVMKGTTVPGFEDIVDPVEKRQKQFRYYKDHYFDDLQNGTDMMRTPIFHNYVMKYFDDLVVPVSDTVNAEIDSWLGQFDGDDAGFRYWLGTLSNKYQESNVMGMDGVTVHLIEQYYLSDRVDWMDDKRKEELRKELRFMKPNMLGNPAPNMELVDTALAPFSLAEIKTDYLVFFFYDPDCGHCKKKTPILKAAYEDIKSEGGEVVGICTISDVPKWKKYIKEKNLNWINLGDPSGRTNMKIDYDVRTTPQVYILDKDRKIIGKKIDVDQVLQIIQDHKLRQGAG